MKTVYEYEQLSPAEKVEYLFRELAKQNFDSDEIVKELVTELSSDYMRVLLIQIIAKYNLEVFEK